MNLSKIRIPIHSANKPEDPCDECPRTRVIEPYLVSIVGRLPCADWHLIQARAGDRFGPVFNVVSELYAEKTADATSARGETINEMEVYVRELDRMLLVGNKLAVVNGEGILPDDLYDRCVTVLNDQTAALTAALGEVTGL